ncbi:MAG: hypothetical protein AAFU54_11210 [Chloroflexota bacterium]
MNEQPALWKYPAFAGLAGIAAGIGVVVISFALAFVLPAATDEYPIEAVLQAIIYGVAVVPGIAGAGVFWWFDRNDTHRSLRTRMAPALSVFALFVGTNWSAFLFRFYITIDPFLALSGSSVLALAVPTMMEWFQRRNMNN